jgi:hypothetical protein
MTEYYRSIYKLAEGVATLEIPEIDVKNYPIYRDDNEDDNSLFGRINAYADELVRRHDVGEPYALGYRVIRSNEPPRLIIRKVVDGRRYEKILGIDHDFVDLGDDKI